MKPRRVRTRVNRFLNIRQRRNISQPGESPQVSIPIDARGLKARFISKARFMMCRAALIIIDGLFPGAMPAGMVRAVGPRASAEQISCAVADRFITACH